MPANARDKNRLSVTGERFNFHDFLSSRKLSRMISSSPRDVLFRMCVRILHMWKSGGSFTPEPCGRFEGRASIKSEKINSTSTFYERSVIRQTVNYIYQIIRSYINGRVNGRTPARKIGYDRYVGEGRSR